MLMRPFFWVVAEPDHNKVEGKSTSVVVGTTTAVSVVGAATTAVDDVVCVTGAGIAVVSGAPLELLQKS